MINKTKSAALLSCIFLGWAGLHRILDDNKNSSDPEEGTAQIFGTVNASMPSLISYTCPFCAHRQKTTLQPGKTTVFCMNCGKKVQLKRPQQVQQLSSFVCPTCGRAQKAHVQSGRTFAFCMNCGQKVQLNHTAPQPASRTPAQVSSTDAGDSPRQSTPQLPQITFSCPSCGRVQKTPVLEGKTFAFCINCGQRIHLNQTALPIVPHVPTTDKQTGNVHAYNGPEDYVFVSYAHRNAEALMPIMKKMQEDGYRIWFDEGIDPGTEWDANIAEHVRHCSLMLAFLSKDYLESENCKDELNFARDIGKNRILIYLENVTLPDGMAMRLNRLQAIHFYRYDDPQKFYDKLYASPDMLNMKNPRTP